MSTPNLPEPSHCCDCAGRIPQAPAHYPPPLPAAKPSPEVAKWVALGTAGTFLAVALAVSLVAFAIGAVSLTVCVVVLRSVFNDFTKER